MRKFVLATLFAAASSAYAQGGPWDGIYSCTINAFGQRFGQFIGIHGQPDGTSVFTLPAVQDRPPFTGWGGGQVAGNVFSGNTNFGRPFRFEGSSRGFSGWVEGTSGGVIYTATGACTRVF